MGGSCCRHKTIQLETLGLILTLSRAPKDYETFRQLANAILQNNGFEVTDTTLTIFRVPSQTHYKGFALLESTDYERALKSSHRGKVTIVVELTE
jgi:hypothetical protein